MTPRRSSWPLLAGAGAALLGGTWAALHRPAIQRADVRLGDALRHVGSPLLDRAVTATTDLGSAYAVLGIAATLFAARRPRVAADVLGVGMAAWNLAQLNKTRVRRERPYEVDGVRRLIRKPTGSSFPSGHAAVGAAVFTVLSGHARGRRAGRLLAALGPYVAFSRVYVGVHYPTDVVGGAGLGLALGALWRGPLAAANAAATRAAWRGLMAAGGAVAAGVRRRRSGDEAAPAGAAPAPPTAAPATSPRRRSLG